MHKTHIQVVWCTQILKRLNNTGLEDVKIEVAGADNEKINLKCFYCGAQFCDTTVTFSRKLTRKIFIKKLFN